MVELKGNNQILIVAFCYFVFVATGGAANAVDPSLPLSCCTFDSDVCGLTTTFWYSSVGSDIIILNSDGNYIWSNTSGAQITSNLYDVDSVTIFSFEYYIDTPNAELIVSFIPTIGKIITLNTITYEISAGFQSSGDIQCTACCSGGGTCSGQIAIQVVSISNTLVAIDTLQRDNGCSSSFCCKFDDISICDFTKGDNWGYSPISVYEIPDPGSPFVYYHYDYTGLSPISSDLSSDPANEIHIQSDTIFAVKLYIDIVDQTKAGNKLTVKFHDTVSDVATELDYVTNSDGGWKIYYFQCTTPHSICCADSCSGNLVFTGNVDASGGEVTYAIDSVGFLGQCDIS